MAGNRDIAQGKRPFNPNTENPFIEDTTTLQPFASGPSGGLTANAVSATDVGGYYTGTELEAITQEIGASLALKAPATPTVGTALATTGTVALDFSTLNGTYQTITLTGNPTFTTSNLAAGRTVTLILTAGGSSRTLAFPAWVFVGAAAPTTLASGKVGVFTVTATSTTDASCVATYAAQP